MFNPKNILVPTDFSAESNAALKEAAVIAERYDSHIFLLHVIEHEILQCAADYCLTTDEVEDIRRKVVSGAMDRLRHEIENIAAAKKIDIMPEVRMGDPVDEIVKEERERNIDLVVTSTHRRKGIRNIFGRGLTGRLINSSGPAEVLVVH